MAYISLLQNIGKRPPKGKARDDHKKKLRQECGLIKIKTDRHGHTVYFVAKSRKQGATVGELNARLSIKSGGYFVIQQEADFLDVLTAKVAEEFSGCGIGTKLYEAAAKWACDNNVNLRSDSTRSEYSDSFWRKQRSKGRAECVSKKGYYARSFRTGKRIKCLRYVLDKCHTDLSGVRSRKRRGK